MRNTTLVLLLCSLAFPWGTPPALAADYYYAYFGERISLALDTSQVAILAPGAPGAELSAAALPTGVLAEGMRQHAVRGWWLADTSVALRRPQDVEQTVAVLARDGKVGFCSPVFADQRGYPIVITPDILVGFRDGVAPERVDAVLKETGPEGTAGPNRIASSPALEI
jgi:hypothetical protein